MTTDVVEAEVVGVGAVAGGTSMTTLGLCFEVSHYAATSVAK